MIWKVRIVEARPTDDENEYEFTAPIRGSDGHEVQILDFTPGISYMEEVEGKMVPVSEPATARFAYPDRSE